MENCKKKYLFYQEKLIEIFKMKKKTIKSVVSKEKFIIFIIIFLF